MRNRNGDEIDKIREFVTAFQAAGEELIVRIDSKLVSIRRKMGLIPIDDPLYIRTFYWEIAASRISQNVENQF